MEKKLTHANFFYGTTYTLIFVFVLHIYTSKKNNEVFRAAHSKNKLFNESGLESNNAYQPLRLNILNTQRLINVYSSEILILVPF